MVKAMELKIPIEIVFDDVNSVIDELGKLQKYKLCEGDDMTLVVLIRRLRTVRGVEGRR